MFKGTDELSIRICDVTFWTESRARDKKAMAKQKDEGT
jgi:hypothetical protein